MPGTKPSVAPPTVSQIGYGILVKYAQRYSSPTRSEHAEQHDVERRGEHGRHGGIVGVHRGWMERVAASKTASASAIATSPAMIISPARNAAAKSPPFSASRP